jgi:hypothetical protein
MVSIESRIEIYGENFNPKKVEVELGINFSQSINPGDFGTFGRYKGVQIPFGSATIESPQEINNINPSLWLLNYLKDKIDIIRKHGATKIHLKNVYYYFGQCNSSLGVEEINLLSEMKIPFLFSVYESKEMENEE